MIPKLPITTIDLDLTNNCVLACDYCFRGAKNSRRLSLENGKAAIDWLIRESRDQKKLMVALFGGEPLMEFELIKNLVPYAYEQCEKVGKSIHFSATTNCVLINDEMIEFFQKYKMTFHTSIDGGPESQDKHRKFPNGKGSSEIVERNVRKVLSFSPGRTARMTVSNDTVHRWMDDVHYLVGLGYQNLAMIPVPEQEWTEDHFEVMKRELRKISDYFIEQYRKGEPIYIKHIDDGLKSIVNPKRRISHCGAGRGYVLIKTDGTIYPCHRFGGDIDAENENQQKWRLGSIFEGWDDSNKRDMLLEYDCRKHVKADCENCIAVHMCGTTCIAISWSCFQDIYKPHPNQCRFTRMFFEEAMRVHYILDCESNKYFIKIYHPERLSKKNRHIKKSIANQQKSNSDNPEVVFIMLSSKSLSPCFMFNGHNPRSDLRLSVEKLKSIMAWATRGKSSQPNLFFLADESEKMEPAVSKFLESIPEQIIVPLMDCDKQKDLQIPFSKEQTVIASNLKKLENDKNSILGRPVIVHVDHQEIEQLSDKLLEIKDKIPQITLRLRNPNELNDDQIEVYKQQLILLKEVISLKTASKLDSIQKVHSYGGNGQSRCPAGRELITAGPDGQLYPCPAFYWGENKGQFIKSHNTLLEEKKECDADGSRCPGCEYVKQTDDSGYEKMIKIYQAETL